MRFVRFLLVLAALGGTYARAYAAPPVAIVSPASHEMRHDNTGKVPVRVVADVPYAKLRIRVDGEERALVKPTDRLTLYEIDRGEHTLEAELLDAHGLVIAVSEPVVFSMWHASRRFAGRK